MRSAIFLCLAASGLSAQPLTERNREAPFCYAPGSVRDWPVLSAPASPAAAFRLSAMRDGAVVSLDTFRFEVTGDAKLRIASSNQEDRSRFHLRIEVLEQGHVVQQQTVEVRPASPPRPIAYYADFGDDLINIFGIGMGGASPRLHHQLREEGAAAGRRHTRTADGLPQYDAAGFDQYFRRLQCQGVSKEILWLLPFPLIADASAYDSQDWREFTGQAQAIIQSRDLARIVTAAERHSSWGWLRDLMAFRLNPALHQALSASALAHGISLAVSYRPFEQAASKYYEIPVFREDGEFLWYYQPLASPTVNAHPDRVGFAHYREVLRRMRRADEGEPAEITLTVTGSVETFLARYREKRDNLRVLSSSFAPIQSDSFVLVRRRDGAYDLTPWRTIQSKAEARRKPITGFDVSPEGAHTLRLRGVRVPPESVFLWIDNPAGEAPLLLDARRPAQLRNRDGADLGRNVTYFSLPETSEEAKKTRTGGITADGEYNPAFFAAEAAVREAYRSGPTQELRDAVLVINRGERFSTEMVDFTLPSARAAAIREIQGVMKYPAFRSIYLNTRSHTQLAGDSRDGVDGVQPAAYYDPPRRATAHLGLDLAYAPRDVATDADLLKLSVAKLANWQPGEWGGQCQSSECRFAWRLARNTSVAKGIRSLITDLRKAFPETPVQIVLPEREAVSRDVSRFHHAQPAGAVNYSAGRYNYIQNIGEGMTLLDLSGTNLAPVLLGVGAFVSPPVLDRYLDDALRDLKGNQGSSYRGPLGIMYEGQYGLKDDKGREAREAAMCRMLARPGQIGEVILYEAADWTYRLPWDGFAFLDHCPPNVNR